MSAVSHRRSLLPERKRMPHGAHRGRAGVITNTRPNDLESIAGQSFHGLSAPNGTVCEPAEADYVDAVFPHYEELGDGSFIAHRIAKDASCAQVREAFPSLALRPSTRCSRASQPAMPRRRPNREQAYSRSGRTRLRRFPCARSRRDNPRRVCHYARRVPTRAA